MGGAVDDIVIIGGGIIGSSIAYHLARDGRAGRVCVVERDPTYEHASTTRSLGGVRQQFSLPENVLMSQYGLGVYRDFATLMAVDGAPAPVRAPRGQDIMAACGQLKSESVRARKTRHGEEAHAAALSHLSSPVAS